MKTEISEKQESISLVCATCNSSLQENQSGHFCPKCEDVIWPKRDNIPSFVAENKNFAFYNRINNEELKGYTFHKFALIVIKEVEGKKPTIFDDNSFDAKPTKCGWQSAPYITLLYSARHRAFGAD